LSSRASTQPRLRISYRELHAQTATVDMLAWESLSTLKTLEGFTWLLGYSGGKDSTVVLHLVAEALLDGVDAEPVIALFNDTMDELPLVRKWAYETLQSWENLLRSKGVNARAIITLPLLRELYMWRVVIRGYPPPTWKFRWCTSVLKIGPTKRLIRRISRDVERPLALLVGSRDRESSARALSHKRKVSRCPVGGCVGIEVLSNDMGVVKVPVIKRWSDEDVWSFLSLREPPWRVPPYEDLINLYGDGLRARFGCWHCLVATRHRGLEEHSKRDESLRLAAEIRLALRMLADSPGARLPKESGGYGQGPLHPKIRKAIHALTLAAAKLYRETYYWAWEALDAPPHGKLSYLEIFEEDSRKAAKLIREIDGTKRSEWITGKTVEEMQALTSRVENLLVKGVDIRSIIKLLNER